jgi:hypothetical protein
VWQILTVYVKYSDVCLLCLDICENPFARLCVVWLCNTRVCRKEYQMAALLNAQYYLKLIFQCQ